MTKDTLAVFFHLLKRDLVGFRREFGAKFFDTCFLFFTNVMVFAYFMPEMGVSAKIGPFILIGAIASFGLFEIVGKVSVLVADIEGDRTISHTLTFPISSSAVFCYIGIFWALTSALLTIFLFPIGKILLFNRFDLSLISYGRLVLIFPTIHLFFGFFSLWLASMIRGMGGLSSIFMRVINPLFMFGAYFYSWKGAFDLSPVIGYLSLLNPMVYVMEGMRSACLESADYLPFWVSIFALWVFILFCGFDAVRRLKKRLDCL